MGRQSTRRLLLHLLVAALLLWTALATGPAAADPADDLPAAVAHRLNETVSGYRATTRSPGLMAVVWTPTGQWSTAMGEADISAETPLSTAMQYRIGSQTKPFVANVILQLVGEGKVGLDDHITRWLANVPNGDRITIRQLLNHTSGLGDLAFGSDPDLARPETYAKFQEGCTVDDVLTPSTPTDDPAQRWGYSNYGYSLLGRVAELAGHDGLSGLIRARIVEPLGLRRTYLPSSENGLTDPYTRGYAEPPGQPGTVTYDIGDASCLWAAGGMVSTLDDLHMWAVALGTGQLLKPDVWQQAHADPVPLNSRAFPGMRYGLGFMKTGDFIGHQGNWIGYDSATYYSPSLQTTISVMDNGAVSAEHDSATGLVEQLATAAFDRALGFGPVAEADPPNP
jgi:D-alanyl-D-alanine carboxypeptidase